MIPITTPKGINLGNEWFSRASFANPVGAVFGNIGRNAMSGPGFYNLDLSLFKIFALTERFRMEIRGEAFGVSNDIVAGRERDVVFAGGELLGQTQRLGDAAGIGSLVACHDARWACTLAWACHEVITALSAAHRSQQMRSGGGQPLDIRKFETGLVSERHLRRARDDKVCFDVAGVQQFVNLMGADKIVSPGDGNIGNWPNVTRALGKLKIKHLLPGHGRRGAACSGRPRPGLPAGSSAPDDRRPRPGARARRSSSPRRRQ